MNYDRVRVLVTGATGYIGHAIATRLVELDASVVGLCRSISADLDRRMRWAVGDICDASLMDELFLQHRPQIVIHLAGVTNASRLLERVGPSFEANARGTVVMLDACARHGCDRFVYCASMEEPLSASAVPSSPYAASKWVGTAYTRMFHSLFAVPTVIVRPYFVYGPGAQVPDKLVPHIITTYLRGESPHLGSPERRMDWVFIDDVVTAFLRAAQLTSVVGREIDVGTGVLTTVRDFADLVRHEIGHGSQPTFEPNQMRIGEGSPVADTQELHATLGWAPEVSLVEGTRRTIKWYRNQAPN